MKHILIACGAIAIGVIVSNGAMADAKVPEAVAEKIRAAIAPWGCKDGKLEQENEASGIYEVDDAKCHGGQFDIKLDKEFKVIVITRD